MTWLDFEGRQVPIRAGDSVASALYRAGVRVFSRSFKYRRPRGLYCLTGDCPNCQLTVNGEPGERACVTPAQQGQRVARPTGWPSPDRDLGSSILWAFKRLMPVGFYYKTLIRPKAIWPIAERVIRKLAGVGDVPMHEPPAARERRNHHPVWCVVGGGVAGLSAALAASDRGESVVLADEGTLGEKLPPGPARERVDGLVAVLRGRSNVTLLERAVAVAVYEGPLVPIAGEDFLHLVHPRKVVVATGAVEGHPVFPGNDIPGLWLGRGAARMAGAHGIAPGKRMVFWGATDESLEHLAVLERAGVSPAAVLVPSALAGRVPAGRPVIADGSVVEARGSGRVSGAVVRSSSGDQTYPCDTIVVSLPLEPRDRLLRQLEATLVVGAGDVVAPGASLDKAAESGRLAITGATIPSAASAPTAPTREGCLCLCEDVFTNDVRDAWAEGFQSTELLKRYTTATMGPCQGAMCHGHLKRFVEAKAGSVPASAPTTARPPVRTIRLEDLAAGARYPLEYRTGLHHRHLAMGATMEWTGVWKRPERYGALLDEYWAVRQRASIMDVGTLGKYRVAGRDAVEFLERLYPCHVANIKPGRSRYALLLNEAGYVFDDGLICSLGPEAYYLTVTSGGADQAEGWFRDWADTWSLDVHVANLTGTLGAINVAGPKARELLASLTRDPVDSAAIPYSGHREITVAGVPCRVLRVGFVGELSFELHYPRLESAALWDALLEAGRRFDLKPHGLEALRLLRLEKGHIIVGQDTDYDSTPAKLGLDWAVKMEKPDFVGKIALERLSRLDRDKELVSITFCGPRAPVDGAQLVRNGDRIGYLTSSRLSPVLGHGIALGWVARSASRLPDTVVAQDSSGRYEGRVTKGPFYDPEGVRLRA